MKPTIKIFGVGNAGLRILEWLPRAEFPEVNLAVINADAHSLAGSTAPEKIEVDKNLLNGLGSGHAGASEPQIALVRESCRGAEVVMLIAGLGGRTGTQMSAAVAKAAQEAGACVLAFVTLPFDCEGSLRFSAARQGLDHLLTVADAVFPLPNQEAVSLLDEATSLTDAYNASSQMLAGAVLNVCRALHSSNVMGIEFAELCRLTWQSRRECAFGSAEASGPDRVRAVVEKLLSVPMLEGGRLLEGAETVMVSVVGGSDLRVAEVNQLMQLLGEQSRGAPQVMGAGVVQGFAGLAVLLAVSPHPIQTADGPAGRKLPSHQHGGPAGAVPADEVARFDTDFLSPRQTPRPGARLVPPPPALTAQQREQFLLRQSPGGRGRKSPPRMRQQTLPLEIVSKGRFDKTEPTVHKGEDLDQPTFIRRGIALN